jgi:hypothetical protein
MAAGFELHRNLGFTALLDMTVATGVAVTMGNALVQTASQQGSVENAVDGSTRIVGVAAESVASSATGTPAIKVWDPRCEYRVNRKATETAGPTHLGLEVDFETARSIDHSDAAANKPIFVKEILTTAAAGESVITFTDHNYSDKA